MPDVYTIRVQTEYFAEIVTSNPILTATDGTDTMTSYGCAFFLYSPEFFVTTPTIYFFTSPPAEDPDDPGGEDPTIYSNCITGDEGDVDMEMFRGNQFTFDCFVRNQLTRERISLVGGVMIMTAKWDLADADGSAVFQLRSDDVPAYIEFTNPAEGEATVSIPPSATSSLPSHRCVLHYDLKFIDVDDHPYTVANGLLVVHPGVTQANA